MLIGKVLPSEVRSQVETSLATLKTDHIDVMLIHCRAEQTLPDRETFEELDKLRQAGKIRFIGSSVYGPEPLLRPRHSGWFDCIEVGYSVLDRESRPACWRWRNRKTLA